MNVKDELERIWKEEGLAFAGRRAGWRVLDWDLKLAGGYYCHINTPLGEIVKVRGQFTTNAQNAMRAKQRYRLKREYMTNGEETPREQRQEPRHRTIASRIEIHRTRQP